MSVFDDPRLKESFERMAAVTNAPADTYVTLVDASCKAHLVTTRLSKAKEMIASGKWKRVRERTIWGTLV